MLRYDCASTFVKIFHARGGFDLGVEIGLLGEPDMEADLAGILAVQGAPRMTSTVAETAESVATVLAQLASLVREYAGLAIDGEPSIFQAVALRNQEGTAQYMERSAGLRWLANLAWNRGDHAAAARYYSQISDALLPFETDRLLKGREPDNP